MQNSALLAGALHKSGRLLRLVTRLQIGRGAGFPWSQVAARPWTASLTGRRVTDLVPDERIRRIGPAGELARRTARRGAPYRRFQVRLAATGRERFSRVAAREVDPGTRYVISTDMAAGITFEALRARGAPATRVLDVAHPFPRLARQLVVEDVAAHGFPLAAYDGFVDEPGSLEPALRELELAEQVLVASTFSAASITAEGVPRNRVQVIPYGVPPTAPPIGSDGPASTLRLVFVGALSERKGVTLLLRAMHELERRKVPAELSLIGSPVAGFDLRSARLPASTVHRQGVTRAVLMSAMAAAHLLVLPSICEGFGLVLIEALTAGTGIITTERSAAPDIAAAHPDAPITITPAARRGELADVFEQRATEIAVDGIDRHAARRAGDWYSLERYGASLSAALP